MYDETSIITKVSEILSSINPTHEGKATFQEFVQVLQSMQRNLEEKP